MEQQIITLGFFVKDGKNEMMIKCNQYDIQDDLKSLINHIEAHSKKKYRSN